MNETLTQDSEKNKMSPLDILGVSLKGIYPKGVCPTCKGTFKWDRQRGYICPAHGSSPHRFIVMVGEDNGKIIRRETSLDGHALHTYGDAVTLRKQIENEKKSGQFDIEKWKSKDKGKYAPSRLILRWYKEKMRALRKGDLKPSYTIKLRSYIKHYFIPFGVKNNLTDIRTIKSTKDFFDALPDRLSPKYRKNLKLALATFFHWCHKEMRVIDEVPFFPSIKVPQYIPQVLDLETRLFIVDNFIMPEHRPIFGFYVVQGARPGEVIALKGDCLQQHPTLGHYVEYRRTVSDGIIVEIPKDKEARINPVFKQAEKFLPERVFASSFVFMNKGKPYTLSVLEHQLMGAFRRYNKAMRAKAEETGAAWEDVKIKLYEFGKHSRSSELYEQGASLQDLQKFHGHSKAETSMLYTKIDVLKRFQKFDNVIEIESFTRVSPNDKTGTGKP
jgi:integrase